VTGCRARYSPRRARGSHGAWASPRRAVSSELPGAAGVRRRQTPGSGPRGPGAPDPDHRAPPDHAFEDRLVHGLLSSPGVVLVRPGGAQARAVARGVAEKLRLLTGIQATAPVRRAAPPAALDGCTRRTCGGRVALGLPVAEAARRPRPGSSAAFCRGHRRQRLWPVPRTPRHAPPRTGDVHPNAVTLLTSARGPGGRALRAGRHRRAAAAWSWPSSTRSRCPTRHAHHEPAGRGARSRPDIVHPPFWFAVRAVGTPAGGPW
jgi:hypothetical protein